MGPAPRADEARGIYHARNRGNARQPIFFKAQDYRWGSLYNWVGGDSAIALAPWPLRRLPNWANRVNQAMTKKQQEAFTRSINHGVPFGSEQWTTATVKRLGLESTIRARGRPRKSPE